jgi:hypothetical protein
MRCMLAFWAMQVRISSFSERVKEGSFAEM